MSHFSRVASTCYYVMLSCVICNFIYIILITLCIPSVPCCAVREPFTLHLFTIFTPYLYPSHICFLSLLHPLSPSLGSLLRSTPFHVALPLYVSFLCYFQFTLITFCYLFISLFSYICFITSFNWSNLLSSMIKSNGGDCIIS